MDELATRLREDAAKIEAEVSAELDARIRASLESVTPGDKPHEEPKPRRRAVSMWWAGSLGGAVAAALILLLVNPDRPLPPRVPTGGVPQIDPLFALELRTEAAVLTQPLKQELENLESDIRKAERAVREDIGLSL